MALDPQIKALLDKGAGLPDTHTLSVAEARTMAERRVGLMAPPAAVGTIADRIVAGSITLWPPPVTPKSAGSWVTAMVIPAPALKPTRMLSLISFTSTLSWSAQAMTQRDRDGESGEARNLGVSRRVAVRHGADGGGDHERDCRCRLDGEVPGRSEQRVAEAAEDVSIDADLRGKAGQRSVGERHGYGIGSERNTGHEVRAQPGQLILAEPVNRWQESAQMTRYASPRHSGMVRKLIVQSSNFARARRAGSAPSSAACAATQRAAKTQSSRPAGNLCSGANRARVIVILEGRDTAGKGGVISRITARTSPRVYRSRCAAGGTTRRPTNV